MPPISPIIRGEMNSNNTPVINIDIPIKVLAMVADRPKYRPWNFGGRVCITVVSRRVLPTPLNIVKIPNKITTRTNEFDWLILDKITPSIKRHMNATERNLPVIHLVKSGLIMKPIPNTL